ncbi:hypothetical protein E3N88_20276 [Mikania micrantha]|uniref:Uncharacterized protein n=1 Tax=Mikania micrantha TaxID=192012 RepID=A0A5N6NID5_9ASTR|nr:hypothetical protein E3N88_20276 [Mikania micrantha]
MSNDLRSWFVTFPNGMIPLVENWGCDNRIREIRKIRFKTMKLGLLGSIETHRGTRWAPSWAFAIREACAGEFEFSEKSRGTRRPINFHHRVEATSKTFGGHWRRLKPCRTHKNILPSCFWNLNRSQPRWGLFQTCSSPISLIQSLLR